MQERQPKLITTMKKLFLIVAAMFAAVSFSACSDDDDNGGKAPTPEKWVKQIVFRAEWDESWTSTITYDSENRVKKINGLRNDSYEFTYNGNSSIKPSRIKYLFIKDIIALIPVISFAVIDIITPDKPHLIIRYAVCIFIYILILATYHWVINIFKIIPYVKYRDLLKIIDAEIEEAPMTFEK